MYDFLIWLGHAYGAYRAMNDAGIWLFQLHADQTQQYMESFLKVNGYLP